MTDSPSSEPVAPPGELVAPADSAGIPWAGRRLESSAESTDDGSSPPALLAILESFGAGEATMADVIEELRLSRLLIPLVAEVATVHERKHAELSIVTVAGPDGRDVLPVFSSTVAMARWNPAARPIPVDAVRVALAAVDDRTDLAVLDPTSATEFAIRRPALWAIAQQRPWVPSYADPIVRAAFEASIGTEEDVVALVLSSGDPSARLLAPELTVALTLRPGLDDVAVSSILRRLQSGWATSAAITERVDSLAVEVRSAS